MRGVFLIFEKEFRHYFTSPLAYVLAGVFSVISGWIFFNYCILATTQQSQSIEASVIIPTFGLMNTLFMFLTPFLTMRLFAEESKMKTIEVLYSSSLSHFQIILGKFLGCLTVCLFIIVLSLIFPIILHQAGFPRWGLFFSSYLGLLLTVSCYIAIGIFASSLTENQIISALISFGLIFGLILIVLLGNSTHNPLLHQIINYLGIGQHYDGFVRGSMKSYNFVYYCSFLFFVFFITEKKLESRNW